MNVNLGRIIVMEVKHNRLILVEIVIKAKHVRCQSWRDKHGGCYKTNSVSPLREIGKDYISLLQSKDDFDRVWERLP